MLLIPIFLGLAASAAVAATWNLYRPVSLFMQSLGLMILPTFSRWVDQGMPGPELRRRVTCLALLFGGAVALYGLVMTLGAKSVLHLLYAGKYDEHWMLVGLFGVSTAASITTGVFASLFKAKHQTRLVSKIWITSTVVTAIFSVPLIYISGVEGALIAFALAYVIAAIQGHRCVKRIVHA